MPSARHPRALIAVCIMASSLGFIDGSVVNVGLPAIGHSLGGTAADLQWVINAYLLPLSALLLLGGALGDRFGARRSLIFGVGLFALGSLGCAIAPALPWLLAARAVQGVGAAVLLPNSLAILGDAFSGEQRGKAVGVWAATSAMAGAIGPVLGGALIDLVSWRAIFLINLPLAAGAIALALAAVAPDRKTDPGSRLDLVGAALITAALGVGAWALTEGAQPAGWTPVTLGAAGCAIALAAAFVWTELRQGDAALTPPALFASPQLSGLNGLTLLLYGALGGFMVMLPFVLIETAHYSATAAGAALLPFPLVMTAGGPITGALAGRLGSRLLLTVGSLVVALSFLLMLRIDAHAPYWTEVLPVVLVMAVGMTGVAAPLTTAVLSTVGAEHRGAASGLNSALARAGGMLATALLGFALASRGEALIGNLHLSALVGAALAAASGVLAFATLRSQSRPAKPAP